MKDGRKPCASQLPGARMERLDGRINTLTWMAGFNITLTLLVLGKLLPMPVS
jgi:hypothetical protein